MNRLNQLYNYYDWFDDALERWRKEGLENITHEKIRESNMNYLMWHGMVDAIRYQRNV